MCLSLPYHSNISAMYHIFVTVEDFTSNGGVIEDGRKLFTPTSTSTSDFGATYKQIGWYDTEIQGGA